MTKKKRFILRTILAVGEGETEQAFLKFLKQIYVLRGRGVSVKTPLGKQGGELSGSVSKAERIKENGDYECVFLLRDLDTREFSSGENIRGILLLGSTPCIEGLFLDVLVPHKRKESWTAAQCKREFESGYLDEKKKLDSRNYFSVFSKEKIEVARRGIPVLNDILNILEGNF